MIEKRFHAELYAGTAVDEAVKTYAPWGAFELAKGEAGWIVRVTANAGVDEANLADELGNYALGATIEGSRRDGGGDR